MWELSLLQKRMDMEVCQAMHRLHCILDQLTSHGCQ